MLRWALLVVAAFLVAACCPLPEFDEALPARKVTTAAAVSRTAPPRSMASAPVHDTATPAVHAVPRSIAGAPVRETQPTTTAAGTPRGSGSFDAACQGPRVGEGVRESEGGKIIGGWRARAAEWPGIVAIGARTDAKPDAAVFFCGGSLIAPNWVMTAAHCLSGESDGNDGRGLYQDMAERYEGYNISGKGYIEVVAGAARLSAVSKGIRAKRFIVHPSYQSAEVGNDIALIELQQPLPGPFARISSSPSMDPPDIFPVRAMVAGFGRTVAKGQSLRKFSTPRGGTGYAMSEELLETAVPTGVKNRCKISDDKICAAEEEYGGRDTCSGDSGGPLIIFDRNNCPYVVGLTSYGDKVCGRRNTFGVYTRVSAYADWVRQYVPTVMTTKAPIDRAALERNHREVWSAVDELETVARGLLQTRQVDVRLCETDGLGCTPRAMDKPLADREFIVIGASARPDKLIVFSVSAQGRVDQLFPAAAGATETASEVKVEAAARWDLNGGRVIAIRLADGASAPSEVVNARDNEGRVDNPVAYLSAIKAALNPDSAAIGMMSLSVQQ